MRNQNTRSHRKNFFALTLGLTLLGGLTTPFTPTAEAQAASLPIVAGLLIGAPAAAASVASGAVELSPTPPNDTQSVAPNIVVTFDDSGSMANDYMGDTRPYDDKSWDKNNKNPWRCAAVIDPRVDDVDSLRSRAMNGVYYNPGVIYSPPKRANGTTFPNADATLTSVLNDGVTANRPRFPSTGSATSFLKNKGWYYNSGWKYGTFPSGYGYYSYNDPSREPKAGEYYHDNFPAAWTCPGDSSSPISGGGPYYYRLKASGTGGLGTPASPNTNNLYDSSNWEAVSITNTDVTISGTSVNQYQNWANWWAYYHTRNLMTRTSISRVFGALGAATPEGGYGSTIRVAWQNLDDLSFQLPASAIITSLVDSKDCGGASGADPSSDQSPVSASTVPNCYRSAFFNWIFQTPASGGTPSRSAAIRAGEFFERSGNNLKSPYWQAGKNGSSGRELVCRQNFHMLVTDGKWNNSRKNVGDEVLDGGSDGWKDKSTGLIAPVQDSTFTLPDGTDYDPAATISKIYTGPHDKGGGPSLSDIGFHYWAKNLRADLYKLALDGGTKNPVPPYVQNKSTGVTTSAGASDAAKTSEIYFNPKNDPANWPHLVQYLIGLGVNGNLEYSGDTDCDVSSTSDACRLRKGLLSWPQPDGTTTQTTSGQGSIPNIDDTWHAAINSRGDYFSAGSPQNLVDQLSSILTNITARSAPSSTGAVNTSVLVPGALGFSTAYSSADWSGTFQAVGVNADGTTTTDALWDAGDILDDTTQTDPDTRKIFTAKESATDGSFNQGIDFKTFSNFDAAGKALLSESPKSSGDDDTGQARVDYLRGDRSNEDSLYRVRTTLLGAIINSQPVYVSYPSSGYRNSWPTGSPEQKAMTADDSDCADTSSCSSYEYFVKNHLDRTPTVYVGANDGMLHAFNAASEDVSGVIKPTADAGKELFAYVPRATYANLGNLTNKNFSFLPTVDGIPVTRDVFFGTASTVPVSTAAGWHTILVGGLRLGGRGVYALDITNPTAMSSGKVLWEFSADQKDQGTWTDGTISNPGGKPSNLGYTFGQPNIGRLNTGKWVVLVPGGYFPDCSKPPYDASNCTYPAAASNKYSSLFVLDAQTGKLIRELKTPDPTSVASHGLSSPVLGDYNDDQIDDVAFAGDLDGNLWRYDLTSADPSSWTVSLAYQPATPGDQPITSMPRLFGDPATNKFIVVFGTGKYLGVSDNTSDSGKVQAVYGIRDLGKTVQFGDLVKQTLSEDASTLARGLTNQKVPATKGGWFFNLAPSTSSAGERVVVTPGALFDTGRVVIQTLIPGTNDPCSATIQGALMVLNAATGGSDGGLTSPSVAGWGGPADDDTSTVGGRVNNPRTGGSLPLVTTIGGGTTLVPGLKLTGSGDVLNINDAIWRRRSWRALNNDQ